MTRMRLGFAAAVIGLGASTAAAQTVRPRIDPAVPGTPVVFDVQVPANWGATTLLLDTRTLNRDLSADSYRHRVFARPSASCPTGMTCFRARIVLDHRLEPGEKTVNFWTEGGCCVRSVPGRLRVAAAPDADADGLPDLWETAYGLSAQSGAGSDGADGDADGDGVSNRDELRAGTMPTGRHLQYFGESSAGDGQQMFPCFRFAWAAGAPGPVRIRLIGDDGRQQIPELDSGGGCGLESDAYVADRVVGVEVESRDPIVVERELGSGRDGYLAAGRAVAPSTEWHFAEGPSLGPVDVFLLAYNPTSSPVNATFTYYRAADEEPVITERRLDPGRTTIWINADEPALRGNFAVAVRASAPIVVDRGLRWQPPGRSAPHESAATGAPQLSARWFFPHVDAFKQSEEEIVVANPNEVGTLVEIAAYQRHRGPSVHYVVVERHARAVVRTSDLGADALVGLRLVSTNGVPIVAEHVQRGAGAPDGRWVFADHGAGAAGTAWALAALFGEPSEIALLNPSKTEAEVEVQGLWLQGTAETPTVRRYRFKVPAERLLVVPMANRSFADEPRGAISSIVRSATIVSLPDRDGRTPDIVVGRTAPAGALGVRGARTEHFVATRLR